MVHPPFWPVCVASGLNRTQNWISYKMHTYTYFIIIFLCNFVSTMYLLFWNKDCKKKKDHERTTTAKNMWILKYYPTSLISYERGWPMACLDGLIKPNQTSHQGARWTSSVSMLKVPVFALIIEISAVWPWCRRSFQDICRGLWIIIAELTYGLFPMIFRMVFPSWEKKNLVCRLWFFSGSCSVTKIIKLAILSWRILLFARLLSLDRNWCQIIFPGIH
jgi:hypothetical protein